MSHVINDITLSKYIIIKFLVAMELTSPPRTRARMKTVREPNIQMVMIQDTTLRNTRE